MQIKICIADDSDTLVTLLKNYIEKDDALKVVGTASDGKKALEILRKENPDILILDLSMPISDGFFVLDSLIEEFPNIKTIVLSGHSKNVYGDEAIKRGAKLYLEKGVSLKNIIEEIKYVASET